MTPYAGKNTNSDHRFAQLGEKNIAFESDASQGVKQYTKCIKYSILYYLSRFLEVGHVASTAEYARRNNSDATTIHEYFTGGVDPGGSLGAEAHFPSARPS